MTTVSLAHPCFCLLGCAACRAREQVDGLLGQRRLYNGTFDCAAQVFCISPALCHPRKNFADTTRMRTEGVANSKSNCVVVTGLSEWRSDCVLQGPCDQRCQGNARRSHSVRFIRFDQGRAVAALTIYNEGSEIMARFHQTPTEVVTKRPASTFGRGRAMKSRARSCACVTNSHSFAQSGHKYT